MRESGLHFYYTGPIPDADFVTRYAVEPGNFTMYINFSGRTHSGEVTGTVSIKKKEYKIAGLTSFPLMISPFSWSRPCAGGAGSSALSS